MKLLTDFEECVDYIFKKKERKENITDTRNKDRCVFICGCLFQPTKKNYKQYRLSVVF